MTILEADPALRLALRAQEHKLLFLGMSISMVAMLHPGLPLLRWMLQLTGAESQGDLPFVVGGKSGEDEKLSFSTRDALTKLSALRGPVVREDILSGAMLLGATRLGDMILQTGPSRRDEPLLQFARHFRNAAAHGDRWTFREGEPETPASCRGVVLTRELNGQRATFETVSPKLYVEFLDDLSNYFVPGVVPPPVPAD